MKLVALILVIKFYSIPCYGQRDSEAVTIWVSRRYSKDIYSQQSMKDGDVYEVCDDSQPTYMVEEQQCIKNDDLFSKCRFALHDNITSNRTLYMRLREDLITDIKIIDTDQQKNMSMNISLCQVTSLEVYRGKENIVEINHSGFTLTDRNTLWVDYQQLAYNSSEYIGELFHMKLSCLQEGKTQSECLFFKVLGRTNVMERKAKLASNCMLLNVLMTFNQSMPAKFNCTVPGTLYDFSTDCLPVPTFNESPTTQVPHSQSTTMTATSTRNSTTLTTQAITTNLTMPNEKQPPKFEVGSRLFYAVVGSGGGIVTVLICCLCCVCVLLVCRRNRMKVSAITSTEMERRISTASRQAEAKNNEKDKDLELQCHMYAVPGELVRSNAYGCNCLEENPAYLKPGDSQSGISHGMSEVMLECSYAIIPSLKGQDYNCDSMKEEPLYQEILPKLELKTSLPQSKETPLQSTVTAENVFYQTSVYLQHQWKEDCYGVPSGRPKHSRSYLHFTQ